MRKFLLLGLGAFAFFCSSCNDDVSSATSDIVVDSSSSVAPIPVEESSSVGSSSSMEPNSVAASSSSEYSSSVSADTVAASSSSVKSSSSVSRSNGRLSHYCDENAGFSCEDTYSWVGGNEEQTIYRYNGDTTEIVPAGRFYIIMECVLTVEERSLLAEHGFVKVGSVTPSRGKDFVLYSSETDTKKAFLDSLLLCFFNTVGADDTSRIDVEILPEDISSDSTVNMYIFCWGDVDVNVCAETVANCGGTDIGVARGFLVSTVPVDSVECLSTSRNITGLEVEREMPVCSPPLPDE